ncbi:MAG: tetratricopeptide repeat protein, partial [Myxococcales bacterium]|nr:tetratricopeptide repeat protein [Myxococcales bacterium]
MPEEPARREAILAAYERLGRGRALTVTGHPDEAEAEAEALRGEAEALDYLPLSLELRGLDIEIMLWRLQFTQAQPQLRALIREAEVAGLDELGAELRVRQAVAFTSRLGSLELQEATLEEAELALDRIGRPDDPRRLELELVRVRLVGDTGDQDLALALCRAAAEHARRMGNERLVARTQYDCAEVLFLLGRYADAERGYRDAHDSFERALGPSEILDAQLELVLAKIALEQNKLDDAEHHVARARRFYKDLVDPRSTNMAALDFYEGYIHYQRFEFEAAAAAFTRVTEQALDHERLAEAWQGLGAIHFIQGDMAASLAAYRQARVYFLEVLGPEHSTLGSLESNIGESLAASGDLEGGRQAYSRALEILERALPPDHPDLAYPYKGRGQLEFADGDLAGARRD